MASEQKPRKAPVSMSSARTPLKNPLSPATTMAPRVITSSQRNAAAANSTTLQPPHSAHTPRTASNRKSRADTIASSDVNSNGTTRNPVIGEPYKRPSSAASSTSRVSVRTDTCSYGNSKSGPRPQLSSTNSSSPMFFHASELKGNRGPPLASGQITPQAHINSKFFFADEVHGSSQGSLLPGGGPNVPPPRVAAPPPNVSSAPLQSGFVPALSPAPTSRPTFSPPNSRPASMVGYSTSRPASLVSSPSTRPVNLTPTALPDPRNHVKFIYANGTEEVLPRRRGGGSEIGSTVSSPAVPLSPRASQYSQASPSKAATGILLPVISQSPLNSPLPRLPSSGYSSRRSSIDATVRHGRTLSIGSTIEASKILKEEVSRLEEGDHENGSDDERASNAPDPYMQQSTAKSRIQVMEEMAANARRERKVMDLEISNASLMAINKTLEREMRKQTAELRRYRRLSRAGKLSSIASVPPDDEIYLDPGDEAIIIGDDHLDDDDLNSDADYSDEKDEEGEPEDDSSSTDSKNPESRRAMDEKRLRIDLSKHKALLVASAKMNASLKRCQFVTEQLIKEGKKALDYKVRPSDVHLGGRVLRTDDDEEDINLENVDEISISDAGGGGERGTYDHSPSSETDDDDDDVE
ncbi:hypothetical protein RUND412_010550 [Rhizina undulata]